MKRVDIVEKTLSFNFPAGTSRGIYRERKVYYVIIKDKETGRIGIGEAAPLPALSCDDLPSEEYKNILLKHAKALAEKNCINLDLLRNYPSILFALETAKLHLESGSIRLFDNDFTRGESSIPINGLVWMGDYRTMLSRLKDKISQGFRCIKIKVGAIDFTDELTLIKTIRKEFASEGVQIRLDANGGFLYPDVIEKLKRLSDYDIHSIEQPIAAGQLDTMADICKNSPIDIALDEELIGVNTYEEKQKLLTLISPKYIILKPSLHGAISGVRQWIDIAKVLNVGYWLTSALETNVGLNAIAQLTAEFNPTIPQGLGTGALFTTNAPYPLEIKGDSIYFNAENIKETTNNDILKWVLESER